MRLLTAILFLALELIPGGKAFVEPLQKRDSVLIADQIAYGFTLEGLADGTPISLQDFSSIQNDTVSLVRGWQIDTLSHKKKKGIADIKSSMVFAFFEEGEYHLPDLLVLRDSDTLVFEGGVVDVKTMPVDTATFEIHDIKPQMRYPVTVEEVLPFVFGFQILALIIIVIVCLINISRRKGAAQPERSSEPAYIVALRKLDGFRGEKYWAPDHQKAFYSGVTDALKIYIEDRFGVDAPEMTTAELFASLKKDAVLDEAMLTELRDLFERADFVKFAKYVAGDDDNARVLPLAVRFVTSTYQTQLEEEQKA